MLYSFFYADCQIEGMYPRFITEILKELEKNVLDPSVLKILRDHCFFLFCLFGVKKTIFCPRKKSNDLKPYFM